MKIILLRIKPVGHNFAHFCRLFSKISIISSLYIGNRTVIIVVFNKCKSGKAKFAGFFSRLFQSWKLLAFWQIFFLYLEIFFHHNLYNHFSWHWKLTPPKISLDINYMIERLVTIYDSIFRTCKFVPLETFSADISKIFIYRKIFHFLYI